MMIRLLVLLLLLTSGCATLPATVEVPIAVPCPEPQAISRPALAVSTLRPESAPAEVVRAYVATLEALAGYAEQLETILDGYRQRGQ